jgi:hypothetical protein
MRPARVVRSAIILKPSTLLQFHRTLVHRKWAICTRTLEKVRQLVGSSVVPADRVLFYTDSIVAALPGIAAGLGISLLCLFLARRTTSLIP